MKQFLILIVYSLLVNTLSFAQQYGEKVFTVKSETQCAMSSSKCDSSKKIIWIDQRIATVMGREEIIQIAATRAFEKLAHVGESSHIIKLYNNNQVSIQTLSEDHSRGSQWWLHKPFLVNFRKTVNLTAAYFPFSRSINVAARVRPVFKFLTLPFSRKLVPGPINGQINAGFCGERRESDIYTLRGRTNQESFPYFSAVDWPDKEDCKTCYACMREEMSAQVEIFPEVFNRKSFCVPNLNRWAISAEEAIELLILHELGHVEAAIYQKSKFELYAHLLLNKQADDEDSAWEFAINIFYFDKINR